MADDAMTEVVEETTDGELALSNPAPERKYRRWPKKQSLSVEAKVRRWFIAITRRQRDSRSIVLLPAAVLLCILFTQRYVQHIASAEVQ